MSKHGKSAIYKIVNKINGKIYVGSCVFHYTRKAQHWYRLRRDSHANTHLQSAWNKYGEENFIFEIIEYVYDKYMLLKREDYWINRLNTVDRTIGYNKGYAVSNLGFKHSEASKRKMSISKKGVKPDPEVARKRGLLIRKAVNQYTKEGELVRSFTGLVEASKVSGIPQYQISKVLSENYPWNKTADGYRWSYVKRKQKL
jgi:hypothetical protein